MMNKILPTINATSGAAWFTDGFVVWLIRGEVKLHAGVETFIR